MKVATYPRVSTEEQARGETIEAQIKELKEFAEKNNHTIVNEGKYDDNGWSGSLLNRPGLDRLRDDARKGLFEAVIFNEVDRLARNIEHQAIVLRELRENNVKVIFTKIPSEDSPTYRLLINILGSFSQFERELILDRTRRGKKAKAEKGLVVGSISPYGYRYILKDKENKKEGYYEVVEEEAIIVKKIFNLFVNKQMSIRKIARELLQKGIAPRRGNIWRPCTISRILYNTTYIGTTYYNKHIFVEPSKPPKANVYRRRKNTSWRLRPKNQWIPISLPDHLRIIDKEVFELAQVQLKKNSEFYPRETKYPYLLKGLLMCGDCGSPIHGMPSRGITYYRCSDRFRNFPSPKECNASIRKASILESIVWNAVSEAIQHPELIIEQVKKLQLKKMGQRQDSEKNLKRIETALIKIKEAEGRLLDAYSGGAISMEQLKAQMSKIQGRKEVLNKEKQRLAEIAIWNPFNSQLKKNIRDYCKVIKNRLKNLTFEEKQQILRLIVNKIVLERDKVRIKGVIPIHGEEEPSRCVSSQSSLSLISQAV